MAKKMFENARWDRIFGSLLVLVILIILAAAGIRSCGRKTDEPQDSGDSSQTEAAASAEVYLSPTAQTGTLAGNIESALEGMGYAVCVAPDGDNLETRMKNSQSMKCTAYVALQSDAQAAGTMCYYQSEIPESLALAQKISDGISGELKDESQRDLYEVIHAAGAVCVVVFGENTAEASGTAQAAAEGIGQYLEGVKANG